MFNIINSVTWTIAILLLVGGGIYLTWYLHYIQFDIKGMLHGFKHKNNSNITPFNSLMMALAARIGVGSLAGIALAIYVGGTGTIFWIWITTLITAVNSFSESVLGMIYRQKDDDVHKGGPAYYMDMGLHSKLLSRSYAIIILVSYIIGFITIQSNTITKSITNYFDISPIIVGFIIAVLTSLIIFKGVKTIANFTSKLVPVMGVVYILLGLYIIIVNIKTIPVVILDILNNAFNFKSFGMGVLSSFVIGIQRGVFSTEAGLGSGAIASSTTDSDNPVKVGLVQVVGIYFVSFIVCTSTAFMILTSDYLNINFSNINGIELTQYALNYHLGKFGTIILIFSILSFAFSTIISGYYYGESNLKYLDKKVNKYHLYLLKSVALLLIILGSVINSSIIWSIVDLFVGVMAIINMYSVIKLRNVVNDSINTYKNNKDLL